MACRQRTPRGRAAGESAAGPELPSPGRCCKLDELEPTRQNKRGVRISRYTDIKYLMFGLVWPVNISIK